MKSAAIVGATGIVGQQFISALKNHPWLKIRSLAASERSAGKRYGEALRDPNSGALRWYVNEQPPVEEMEIIVQDASKFNPSNYDVIFTAIESDQAEILEPKFANDTPVISTASAFRYDDDVPIIIPGVNSKHTELLEIQKKKRRWRGFIVPIPNCTTTGLAISLKPIIDSFGIDSVIMTSMQAVSGAGRSPGVIALDITDNVIPFIPKEEEKVQIETKKILGEFNDNNIISSDLKLSCTCTRVNVLEGHTESVFISTSQECSIEDIKKEMRSFSREASKEKLPSSPEELIVIIDDPFRPQPRIDRDTFEGMATSIGRIRRDEVLENGFKYILVSHNTKMGAAKGAILTAELLVKKGYI
jgi:aspartate-semialdehyde dehydrogenase